MRSVVCLLLGASLLAAAAMPASASECTLKEWTDGGQGGRPIHTC
jgi:hypothetical protein